MLRKMFPPRLGLRHTGRSQKLPTLLISQSQRSAASARQPGYGAKFAGTHAGMVAEEASEMRRLGKAELVADVADARRLVQNRIDRPFHAHDVQVDLRRHPNRGFEQPEEMRAG